MSGGHYTPQRSFWSTIPFDKRLADKDMIILGNCNHIFTNPVNEFLENWLAVHSTRPQAPRLPCRRLVYLLRLCDYNNFWTLIGILVRIYDAVLEFGTWCSQTHSKLYNTMKNSQGGSCCTNCGPMPTDQAYLLSFFAFKIRIKWSSGFVSKCINFLLHTKRNQGYEPEEIG